MILISEPYCTTPPRVPFFLSDLGLHCHLCVHSTV